MVRRDEMALRAKVLGTGSYLPPKVVTNDDLAQIMNTSDEWIQQRSGIKERRFVDDGMMTSDLALEASRAALASAGLEAGDLDMIVVASFTPDHYFPGVSSFLQRKLGLDATPAMDLRCQCTGFVYALQTARAFVESGIYQRVLVCGSELHSRGLEFSDRGRDTAVLFGDGAGALILGPSEEGDGILNCRVYAQGEHAERLWMDAPGLAYQGLTNAEMIAEGRQVPAMDGRFVFKHAVARMPEVLLATLAECDLGLDDVDHFLFHQANLRINEMVAKKLQADPAKVHNNIHKTGNTSAATLPILLDQVVSEGKLKRGELVTMTGFGSGFTWGSCVFRY
tara:strand:- start:100 stop:1113 length:1014 start_codon:yes stop_codon:yes gene_type:complete